MGPQREYKYHNHKKEILIDYKSTYIYTYTQIQKMNLDNPSQKQFHVYKFCKIYFPFHVLIL